MELQPPAGRRRRPQHVQLHLQEGGAEMVAGIDIVSILIHVQSADITYVSIGQKEIWATCYSRMIIRDSDHAAAVVTDEERDGFRE